MTTTPTATDPIDSPALAALNDLERAFILGGTRAEFNRASRLILPFVNGLAYEFKFIDCDCQDAELWYVRGAELAGGYFYLICHEHRLQPLGRATRCAKLPRSDDGGSDRTTRRRVSGVTTRRWHVARGS